MTDAILSKCGMRCDLCLLYRPNVQASDRRAELCAAFRKVFPGFEADPGAVICDGCACEAENAVRFDPACKARACVKRKGYPHCGACDEYPCEIFPAEPTREELVQKIDVEHQWTWEEEALMEAYACRKHIDALRVAQGERRPPRGSAASRTTSPLS